MKPIYSGGFGGMWKLSNASLQSSAADLGNVQLVLTAELAADYFTLRELDAEYQVVVESANDQRKALDLLNNRHAGGIASGLEVAQQATVLDSTISQAALVQESRAQYEHAIAVLVGQSASAFSRTCGGAQDESTARSSRSSVGRIERTECSPPASAIWRWKHGSDWRARPSIHISR